ncbi:hypothetical protein MHY29_00590 [Micrococcus sp. ACRRV]|uniref:hypothetical protein n=1 Tax=Micrococcus sp. ACRRV TaxID=2918203 RepID=UPI001EF26844|nr:hypothetical protein [Micrococcus sp. ACRRV]MCG7421354.1 hypothetical protein [Micrococcus sp. ACRRV]
MRSLLSLLSAVLAALLAVLATAGALVDRTAHQPDTVRQVAERIAADDAVRAAVPRAVTDSIEGAVPESVPAPLTQLAQDIVRPIAEDVAKDPDVATGFADTADEARRAWLMDLERARDGGEHAPGGEFRIPFGPVAQSGVASAVGDLETRLRSDQLNLPGQSIVEAIVGVDVGTWAADTLVKPLYDRAAELRDSTDLTMTVRVDALAGTDRATVARWVDASAHWRWAAGGSVLALVASLLLARRGRRGLALAVAGVTVLLAVLLASSAMDSSRWSLAAPDGATGGVAALARAAEAAFRPAVADVLAPWLGGLTTWGTVALLAGLVLMAIEVLAGPVRRRLARTRPSGTGSHTGR